MMSSGCMGWPMGMNTRLRRAAASAVKVHHSCWSRRLSTQRGAGKSNKRKSPRMTWMAETDLRPRPNSPDRAETAQLKTREQKDAEAAKKVETLRGLCDLPFNACLLPSAVRRAARCASSASIAAARLPNTSSVLASDSSHEACGRAWLTLRKTRCRAYSPRRMKTPWTLLPLAVLVAPGCFHQKQPVPPPSSGAYMGGNPAGPPSGGAYAMGPPAGATGGVVPASAAGPWPGQSPAASGQNAYAQLTVPAGMPPSDNPGAGQLPTSPSAGPTASNPTQKNWFFRFGDWMKSRDAANAARAREVNTRDDGKPQAVLAD